MMKFIKTKQLELDSMVLQLHQRGLETFKQTNFIGLLLKSLELN